MSDQQSANPNAGSAGQPRRLNPLFIVALFMIAAGLVAYSGQLRALLGLTPGMPANLVGKQAPAFETVSLSGGAVRFPSDYSGKLVLVEFWATWCAPCVGAIPRLRELHEEFADQGLVIISVNLDGGGMTEQRLRTYVAQREMSWTHVLRESDSIARRYNVQAIPAMFLVDGTTGEFVAGGAQLDGAFLRPTVEARLEAMNRGGRPPSRP